MSQGSESFPKSSRVRTRRDFVRIQDQGIKVSAGPLLGLALRNPEGHTRLGITVTSKVGNAVERVRIRRHVRELYRKRQASLPPGVDLVLVARGSAREADFEAMRVAFESIVAKLARVFR